jgi:hypothetical protein
LMRRASRTKPKEATSNFFTMGFIPPHSRTGSILTKATDSGFV